MTTDFSILDRVRSVFVSYLRVTDEAVHPATSLDDLGLDSLDRIQMAIEIEKVFDIEISLDRAPSFTTVGDYVSEVEGVVPAS